MDFSTSPYSHSYCHILLLVSAPFSLKWSSSTQGYFPWTTTTPALTLLTALCFHLNKIQIPSMTFNANSGPGNTYIYPHIFAYPFLFLFPFSIFQPNRELLMVPNMSVLFFLSLWCFIQEGASPPILVHLSLLSLD